MTMNNINIDFKSLGSNEVQDYEKSDKNYIQIEVQLPNGEIVSDPNYCVTLKMSKDAMIGLAKNLLKEAYAPDPSRNKLRMWELFPALPSGATQVLGVCMHPRSCEFKIFEEDDGPLQDLLQKK